MYYSIRLAVRSRADTGAALLENVHMDNALIWSGSGEGQTLAKDKQEQCWQENGDVETVCKGVSSSSSAYSYRVSLPVDLPSQRPPRRNQHAWPLRPLPAVL